MKVVKEVYITEGKYRVVSAEYNDEGWDYRFIEHNCPHRDTPPQWFGHVYIPEFRGLACCRCHSPIPEGIQAVFWFLLQEEDR